MSEDPDDIDSAGDEPSGEGSDGNQSPHEDAATAPAARQRIPWWILLALLPAILMLSYVSNYPIQRSAASMGYPYQLDREEGFLLDQGLRIAEGKSIYHSLDKYPYTVGNYPPVYPALLAASSKIGEPSLRAGRLIVMLFVLVIVGALTNVVMRDTGSAALAFLCIVLFLATWDVNDWIAYARVDFPALALGLFGFACLTSPHRQVGLFFGSLAFLAAFFTKQTQIVAPAAVFLALLFRREWSRALFLALILGGCGAMLLVFANISTRGEFLRHTVLYNANEIHGTDIVIWLRHLWRFGAWKIVAAVVGLVAVAALWLQRSGSAATAAEKSPLALPASAIYLILAALSLVSTGKAGSASNYLLEFHAALALFVALGLGRLLLAVGRGEDPLMDIGQPSGLRRWMSLYAAAAMIVLLTIHGMTLVVPVQNKFLQWNWKRAFSPPPDQNRYLALVGVQLAVQETKGDVLCEEPIFAILEGKPVLFQPFIMSQLAHEGKWDQSSFVADLRKAEKFELIVTTQDVRKEDQYFPGFTKEMREAIREGYDFVQQVGGYFLYAPKGKKRTIYVAPTVMGAPPTAPAAARDFT